MNERLYSGQEGFLGALKGKVALVAGATRGAGRGIACMLGEAGAAVYCSGRSTREHPCTSGFYAGRPETIDETAEMVTRYGGKGIAVRTDHLVPEQVEALVDRVRREQGRLDVLVNDISEGERHEWKPFWKVDIEKGFRMLRSALHSHIITSRYAVPLMLEHRGGLVAEIGDGDTLDYRATLFYDLVKISVSRLAFAMAEDLHKHGIAAIAITPGFMRTEAILDHFGVTEANWREGGKKDPNFLASETPFFVAARLRQSRKTRGAWKNPAACTARGGWRANTASRTSTDRSPTGANKSISRRISALCRRPVSGGRSLGGRQRNEA